MNSQVSVINGKLKGEDDKFYGNLILPWFFFKAKKCLWQKLQDQCPKSLEDFVVSRKVTTANSPHLGFDLLSLASCC
jgi:hypothetical protein